METELQPLPAENAQKATLCTSNECMTGKRLDYRNFNYAALSQKCFYVMFCGLLYLCSPWVTCPCAEELISFSCPSSAHYFFCTGPTTPESPSPLSDAVPGECHCAQTCYMWWYQCFIAHHPCECVWVFINLCAIMFCLCISYMQMRTLSIDMKSMII